MTMFAMLLGLAFAGELDLPERDVVRVATFNVWGLPWPLAPDRGRRLRRVGAWAAEKDLDVVALQEVWGPSGKHVDAGLEEAWALAQPDGPGDSGLAVLSRRGVEPAGLDVFAARRGPDALKRKGVWWVDVAVPSGTVALGVVHLQAGGSERNAEVRRSQLEDVLAGLPEGPVVVLGDFNLHDGTPVDAASHAMLEAHGLVEVSAGGPTSRYGRHRLDRVYVRGVEGVAVRVGKASPLSDHRPVYVDLVVE